MHQIESHQFDEPTNKQISKTSIVNISIVTLLQENKKYKIYKIKNISSEVTPSTGMFQVEVKSFFSFSDDWLSYNVKRSKMGEVNNDLKLIDMRENEMSNNVAIAMNDNEQGRSNASESDTIMK